MSSTRAFQASIPTAALALGITGLIPFLGLVVFAVWGLEPFGRSPVSVLALYAATVLSFMGAIHWGLAMADYGGPRDTSWSYAVSVMPALIAWFAQAFFPPAAALRIMAAAFALLLVYDIGAVRRGLAPSWYTRLRWPLTTIVVACLLLASYLG